MIAKTNVMNGLKPEEIEYSAESHSAILFVIILVKQVYVILEREIAKICRKVVKEILLKPSRKNHCISQIILKII